MTIKWPLRWPDSDKNCMLNIMTGVRFRCRACQPWFNRHTIHNEIWPLFFNKNLISLEKYWRRLIWNVIGCLYILESENNDCTPWLAPVDVVLVSTGWLMSSPAIWWWKMIMFVRVQGGELFDLISVQLCTRSKIRVYGYYSFHMSYFRETWHISWFIINEPSKLIKKNKITLVSKVLFCP